MKFEEWGQTSTKGNSREMWLDWKAEREENKKIYEAALSQAVNEITRLEKEVERYDKALQSLTPGGSEFVHDPERCVRFVQGVRSTEIDMIKRLVQKGKRSHD